MCIHGLDPPEDHPRLDLLIRNKTTSTKRWGRYVKLGLTARTVEQRIREHQTGNPRLKPPNTTFSSN